MVKHLCDSAPTLGGGAALCDAACSAGSRTQQGIVRAQGMPNVEVKKAVIDQGLRYGYNFLPGLEKGVPRVRQLSGEMGELEKQTSKYPNVRLIRDGMQTILL